LLWWLLIPSELPDYFNLGCLLGFFSVVLDEGPPFDAPPFSPFLRVLYGCLISTLEAGVLSSLSNLYYLYVSFGQYLFLSSTLTLCTGRRGYDAHIQLIHRSFSTFNHLFARRSMGGNKVTMIDATLLQGLSQLNYLFG
jgi:hypothetical protein